jgi:hypothetical protein
MNESCYNQIAHRVRSPKLHVRLLIHFIEFININHRIRTLMM